MNGKVIEDLARMASGAVGTVVGLRDEAGQQVRERFDRVLARSDMVSREEFEVVRDMAATARAEQEVLADRVEKLEAQLAEMAAKASPARRAVRRTTNRTRTAKKPASK
ncbi:MAG: accessory factor UbiK family protein [Pseudomonadota bacterium]